MKPGKTTLSFVALACALTFALGCVSPPFPAMKISRSPSLS